MKPSSMLASLASVVASGIRAIAAPAAVAIATLSGVAIAHADVTVVDNHKTLDVDCARDAEIRLVGNHITVTARGVCARIIVQGNHATVTGSSATVHVSGNHNTLTLAAADDVTIDGNDNTVVVRKPVKLKAPRIANTGNENHITPPK